MISFIRFLSHGTCDGNMRRHGTCDGNITAANGANIIDEYTDLFCGIPISSCKNRIDAMQAGKA